MVAVNRAKQWAGSVLMIAGALAILAGFCVLAYQNVLWLREGFWAPVEVRALWTALGAPEPAFAWRGIQRIAFAVLGWPLSLGLVLAGFCVFLYGGTWLDSGPRRPSPGR